MLYSFANSIQVNGLLEKLKFNQKLSTMSENKDHIKIVKILNIVCSFKQIVEFPFPESLY